ncbi:MAG: MCP four helix bundle domain-containing protein [Piscinibacter sp.]|nr:MCP four helix bundle domain-containing protein [Piscinibacter sp.]
MNLHRLPVRAKLAAGFGTLAALVVAVSALSIRALGDGHTHFAGYVNDIAVRITLANDVLDATNARAIGARNLVLVSGVADREAERAATVAAHEKVGRSIAKLKEMIANAPSSSEQERQLAAEIERVETLYSPVALGIVSLALDGKRDDAVAKMNVDCRPLLAKLLDASNRYIDYAVAQSKAQVNAADAAYAFNRNVMIGACVVAIGLAAALALLITRGLTRSLGAEPAQLGDAARRVAEGDLGPVPGADTAPAGSVLASLANMQQALARVVGQVRNASDSIATGSAEIATGNADLSQRTEEQASNLQQTAASMEQMNSTVKNNADTARQANQLAGSASAAAERGGAVVGQVVATMDDISASSRKIADIIGVIDGIAFQTNILALNAAVEAARAGEQGRGFAVVASEVRNLAQRSAEAAKEIKALIGDSVDKVETGSKLVDAAGKTMEEIVQSVKRVTDIMSEITAASLEQSSGIEQVNQAIAQMDQVTQQNAAMVEETTAASGALAEETNLLQSNISQFQLSGGGRPAGVRQPVQTPRQVSRPARAGSPVAPSRGGRSKQATALKLDAAAEEKSWEEF